MIAQAVLLRYELLGARPAGAAVSRFPRIVRISATSRRISVFRCQDSATVAIGNRDLAPGRSGLSFFTAGTL